MKNAYELRRYFSLKNHNTAITRDDYETFFHPTRETVTFTFQGWDGKSYDGESRKARVLRTDVPGFEDVKFVKVGKAVHYVDEELLAVEKATGESHPVAGWVVDVLRA